MGALFWWNFWNITAVLAIAAMIVGVTVWVRRRLNAQRRAANSPTGSGGPTHPDRS